jgi:predicted RNase H-like HicB family nuclease
MRHVLLYMDEDGVWIAEVPSLPGCVSDGRTREEALERVKEAIELYIETLEELNKPIPEEFDALQLATVETVA